MPIALATFIGMGICPVSAASTSPNDGTVTIEKLSVPLPKALSPEIRDRLINHPWPHLAPDKMEAFLRDLSRQQNEAAAKKYAVIIAHTEWSGVQVNIVTPLQIAKGAEDAVLLHIHGGGFASCGGDCSFGEAIPIAGLSGIKVISVDYSLAPKAQFPVAVNEIVSVYEKLLKDYKPEKTAIFGSSAGATLAAEVTATLIKNGIPVPAALGIFAGGADLADYGDSANLYTLSGFAKENGAGTSLLDRLALNYAGKTDLNDPLISPIHSDLSHFPPALFMTSTRDILLSPTVNFQRALHRAGVKTQMEIFDGLYHTFWLNPGSPETDEALASQACYLAAHVGAETGANPVCRSR
jgi:acetyl esterase/lipase